MIIFVYYSKYLGVDDDDFGRWELVSEGGLGGFALFLIVWIMSYNFFWV